MNSHKVGLTLGSMVAVVHLVWITLVVLGLAQSLVDFVFWAHMVENPLAITGFDLTAAVTLLVVTFVIGYLVGWVFAYLWNWLNKK